MPTYYFDSIINPISAYKVQEKYKKNIKTELDELDDDELDEIEIDADFKPFLEEEPLYDNMTSSAIALLFAPVPFDQRTGRTRRAFDVTLVAPWFKERADPKNPVKVRVSYQKLLK